MGDVWLKNAPRTIEDIASERVAANGLYGLGEKIDFTTKVLQQLIDNPYSVLRNGETVYVETPSPLMPKILPLTKQSFRVWFYAAELGGALNDFYGVTCNNAKDIVSRKVKAGIGDNETQAATVPKRHPSPQGARPAWAEYKEAFTETRRKHSTMMEKYRLVCKQDSQTTKKETLQKLSDDEWAKIESYWTKDFCSVDDKE